MHILITGGTGFLGKALTREFIAAGNSVTVLTRQQHLNSKSGRINYVNTLSQIGNDTPVDAVVNLAGASINARWTNKYKQTLIDSRVQTTENLIAWLTTLSTPPKALLTASAIGYYGNQGDNKLTEDSAAAVGFTHQMCQQWEQAALKANKLGIRTCIFRLGVVLAKHGGALKSMLPPFKLGLGGVIGSGEQYFSWVHLQDFLNVIMLMLKNANMIGIYNLTAPQHVSNRQWTLSLGKALHRPTWLPMPGGIVKMLFGEMGETLLLEGQRVVPERLLASGYHFNFPTVDSALNDIAAS